MRFAIGQSHADGSCMYRSVIKSLWFRMYGSRLNHENRWTSIVYQKDETYETIDQMIETILLRWLRWSIHLLACSSVPPRMVGRSIAWGGQEYLSIQTMEQLCDHWFLTRLRKRPEPVAPNQVVLIPYLALFRFMRRVQVRYLDVLSIGNKRGARVDLTHFSELSFLFNPIYLPSQDMSREIPVPRILAADDTQTEDLNALTRQAIVSLLGEQGSKLSSNQINDHFRSNLTAWGGSEEIRIINLLLSQNPVSLFGLVVYELVQITGADGAAITYLNDNHYVAMERMVCIHYQNNHYSPCYSLTDDQPSFSPIDPFH